MGQMKQILIAGNNETNIENLKDILAEDYKILSAENENTALHFLRKYKAEIALILLEFQEAGIETCRLLDKIQEDEDLSVIPVIVMAQEGDKESEVSVLSHGAADYITIPYEPQVLLHRLTGLIRLREAAAMANALRFDRLTGLYSKEYFYRIVNNVFDENPDKEYSVICTNLEDFKLYNDAFGREEGDKLLVKIAGLLKKHAGSEAICCRYSADRFLFLVERHTSDLVKKVLDRGRPSLDPELFENIIIKLGIYEVKDKSVRVEQMCDRAQLAVESIKGLYNEFYGVYDEALKEQLIREKKFTDAMEYALKHEEFVICYQPEYSLKSDCMVGVEALVRWVHPQWGIVYPYEYIPLFEKNGFISHLDYYVWESICRKLKEWKDRNMPLIPVSVNVSRTDVYMFNLVEVFTELIEKYELEPSHIRIEITETAYTENPEQITKTVKELREKGFVAELDNFGSGYSSLNAMGQLMLDVLKLDMNFVWNELSKPAENCLIGDVINMAHRMHMTVIAQGVEDRVQLKRLQSMGCDFAQGFYLSGPLYADELEELLKTKNYQNILAVPFTDKTLPKVLVVNDNIEFGNKFNDYFADYYQIIKAENTKAAFDIISENNDLHAVILSLSLTNDNARDFMIKMRQNPRFWKIPIVCVSTCLRITGDAAVSLDADDLICDNFPMEEIHKRIERLADIVAFQIRENTLEDKANRDYLTGLLNRRGLKKAVDSISLDELPMAVCMFDLDGLKKVNDNLGHDVGDYLIKSFADTLLKLTKGEDIRCRYGGDEFVLILKRLKKDVNIAKRICEEICRQFAQQMKQENIPGATSCGIAICNNNEIPSMQIIRKADKALYLAKRENRGSCCVYGEGKNE